MNFTIDDDIRNNIFNVSYGKAGKMKNTRLYIEYTYSNKMTILNLISEFLKKIDNL
jgi:hypothetical protein